MTVTNVWADVTGPPSTGGSGGQVTLVQGTTFCLSDPTGDVHPGSVHGLFVQDTRVLSGMVLRVDGEVPQPLTRQGAEPWSATFIGRHAPRPGDDGALLVVRRRQLDGGLWERICLRNPGSAAAAVQVCLSVHADFADLFVVKEGRSGESGTAQVHVADGQLTLRHGEGDEAVEVVASSAGADAHPDGRLTWSAVVPGRGTWEACVRFAPAFGGTPVPMRPSCVEEPREDAPAQPSARWRRGVTRVISPDPGLVQLVDRSIADLASLRITDPRHPGEEALAAGAPWFMALFGRDSLLAAWMLLPVDPTLAAGTLRTLARYQGLQVDPVTEEQPGRILHEIRFGRGARLSLGGRNVYYGSIDATPLFVMLLGELLSWGAPLEQVEELLPHADAALAWIEQYGDRDGDGFVEYERATDRGLLNQGWKDSGDAVTFADGSIAEAPIALAEVQGYVYAAFQARARIAAAMGHGAVERHWAARAAALRTAFDEAFWLADRGYHALGLDGRKRPIDALASNMGHCLWTGIVPPERAPAVADRLMAPDMFTGFGIRTLSSTMGAYNPMSYHNGSVWPHDTAIAAAGLMRYGFDGHAQRLVRGLVQASRAFDGAMPELLCGFDSSEFPEPIPFPTACSPQAWAAAAPLLLLRTMLRLDADVPTGGVGFSPVVPEEFLPLRVRGLTLAGRDLSADVTAVDARLGGVPDRVQVAP